jgi:tetratricopeptide (TPR) repeat protein
VKELQSPDTHHLSAAKGWLELGNHLEANEELDNISPALRAHPDVLEVRWHVFAAAQKWEMCLEIGSTLVAMVPNRPETWRHRSVALHKLKRTLEAYDHLQPALAKFPKDWAVHYDIACYACRLGKLDEARAWLEKAFSLGDAKQLKQMALDDPDLEMIWTGF